MVVPTSSELAGGQRHRKGAAMEEPTVVIDCDSCVMAGTGACSDCLVTFLVDREPDDAVVIRAEEARAVRLLSGAGLVPSLRFVDRAG
jgi:hypothetical protein